MKKYLIKILLFFIAVAVVDILFGYACQYMNDHSKGGGIKSRYYVCKESNEDVLVFGSSRAKHHYVPEIIEDSLDVTCYNAGEDGNGIILSYGFLKMITRRYSPKLIIYDLSDFDLYKDDNLKYLDLMKPYYNEPGIDTVFWVVNPKSRVMMASNLYRYNTTCLRVLGNFIHPLNNYSKGYFPLTKTMDYEPEIKGKKIVEVDDLKIHFFDEFVRLSKEKGIALVCCVSPSYKGYQDGEQFEPIERLCIEQGIPFLNNAEDTDISYDKQFFRDRTHMNDKGARFYSSKLMATIKGLFTYQ